MSDSRSRKISDIYQRLETLQKRGVIEPGNMAELLTDALEELQTSQEELSAAEEELYQKNEELTKSHKNLEAERQRYMELFDCAPDGYLVTDPKGNIQEANYAAAAMLSQSQDLLALINDVLDFSKIDREKAELELQPFDLRRCVEKAIDLVAAKASEKGLDLAYTYDKFAPEVILGDPARLRQVLANLLSNAVKK